MAYVYFPGCKYTALSADASSGIKAYLHQQHGMEVTGCCRKNHQKLNKGDTALVVCPTCLSILKERAPQAETQSIWEFLACDDRFLWPEYRGRRLTVQDCKDTWDNQPLRDAVRKILKRMEVTVLEIPQSLQKVQTFCNLTPTNTKEMIQEHCKQFTTDTVVCYCTGCHNVLKVGGMRSVHLMDLIMGAEVDNRP